MVRCSADDFENHDGVGERAAGAVRGGAGDNRIGVTDGIAGRGDSRINPRTARNRYP
jgi:hypothetical protein